MNDEQFAQAKETAAHNLVAWREGGVVKTLKYYTADDADVCAACWGRHGLVVQIENGTMGDNLPPLAVCESVCCRCYFRPEQVSMA